MVQWRILADLDRGQTFAWLRDIISVQEVARGLKVAPSVIGDFGSDGRHLDG